MLIIFAQFFFKENFPLFHSSITFWALISPLDMGIHVKWKADILKQIEIYARRSWAFTTVILYYYISHIALKQQ